MESNDNLCLVCHEHIEFFAIGRCDHPICFKCSTRMRALCDQFYCPICRTDLREVFFLTTKEKFGEMPVRKFLLNRKLKIQFENETVRERFEKLLEHKCTKCPDRYAEKNFKALRDHMRRVHTLFYCDLCLELKIFTSERKVYNRQDLATHRRLGDKDDTSYKGHPLCQFCEERYLDKDELYKHLRKEHFFCHFCESLGSQEFYDDYVTLREHFQTDHYLCEEGDCFDAQFTNAFRSDIDLKSHQAHEHSKAQSKLQSRQERTINIDINLVPRHNSRPLRGREQRGDYEDGRRGGPRHQGREQRGDYEDGRRGGPRHQGREQRGDYEDSRRGGPHHQGREQRGDYEDSRRGGPHHQGREQRGDHDDSRRGGPRHQGNRGGRNDRYNNISYRERHDVEQAIQASLSTMKEEDMKKGKSKPSAESFVSSDEEITHTEENFPVLGAKPQSQVECSQPTGARSQTPVSTVTSTAVTSTTTDSKTSLADRLAMSNSMSVQHGVLNDFPTLSPSGPRSGSPKNINPPRGRGSNFNSVFNVKKTEEDFPGLPSNNKSNKATQRTWTQPGRSDSEHTKKSNQKKKTSNQWTTPPSYDVNDFPNLGAPSNKSHNERWFKSNTSSKAPKLDNSVSKKTYNDIDTSENIELSTKDVLDRFSPVNVPDSPKTERTKNKKKKKKDKVTEIKSEVNGNCSSLKGNSSLDDIASMLMKSDKKETKIETNIKGESTKEVTSKNEMMDKSKAKKKVDKIERRMATEKEVQKLEELTLYESEEVIQPEPVKFAIADKEFPCLGTKSPPKKPPPGFKQEPQPVQSTAPPGFAKPAAANNKPPPGFGSQNMSEAFTNDTIQERAFPMSADLGNYQYSQPSGFQERNRMLIGTVQSFCAADSTQFADFKHISGEFRRSEIPASQYYKRCGDILGKENFLEVLFELLVLLPDIDKQHELHTVYMQAECMKKDDKVLKISGKSKNAKGAWTKTQSGFLTCQTCRQVLVRKDYNEHMSLHNLDTDFPSLGDGVPRQNVGVSGTWIKAK